VVKKVAVLLALGVMLLVGFGYAGRGASRGAGPAAGPDVGGKLAYVRAGGLWLYADGNQRQLTNGPQDAADKRDVQPAFSPDGTQIVYTRMDEGFSDLYRLDVADPSQTVALTENRPSVETGASGYNVEALWAMQPAWSLDGERIAYVTDVGTEYPGLFSMDPNGTRSRRLESLNHGIQGVEDPSWSPDGNRIAVANYVTGSGNGQIWSLNIATGRWTEITAAKEGAYDPAWSPDGTWIAFTMRQGNQHNIYVVPTDAEQWTEDHPTPIQLTTDGASRSPAWSPDGTRIAYLSLKDASFDIYTGEVQSGPTGNPILGTVQGLTEKANIDATSGLAWGQ
jgi:TolB protein